MSDESAHDETETGRPVLRLRPKKGARLRDGAPWVWGDELVLDRRAKKLAPGTLAELQSPDREPIGLVAANTGATLAARLLDDDPAAEIDQAWFAARLTEALALRQTLFDAPFYRLIHAEADGMPGVVIDRFGDAAVIQPNAAWADARIDALSAALREVTGVATIILNGTSRVRKLEGLEERTEILCGAIDGPLPVPMNGATYMADVEGGQKTGLFYDQRPNHAFAARLAKGGRMLDVFSHVGGFSLAALAGGAAASLAVDGSAPALALAEEGARRTGVADRFATRKGDAFDVMKALEEEGEVFDIVVSDPPAFAPTRSARDNGLRAYARAARLAAKLVRPGGFLVCCSCSHAADPESFHDASAWGIRQAGRRAALIRSGRAGPDHPVHAALPETSYLKANFYRLL